MRKEYKRAVHFESGFRIGFPDIISGRVTIWSGNVSVPVNPEGTDKWQSKLKRKKNSNIGGSEFLFDPLEAIAEDAYKAGLSRGPKENRGSPSGDLGSPRMRGLFPRSTWTRYRSQAA